MKNKENIKDWKTFRQTVLEQWKLWSQQKQVFCLLDCVVIGAADKNQWSEAENFTKTISI